MIFNIPYTYCGYWFAHGETVYIAVNAAAVFAYCLIWIILWNKSNMTKALLLSIIPSGIFVFSGVIIVSIPLLVFSALFAVTHILISVKNIGTIDAPVDIYKERS